MNKIVIVQPEIPKYRLAFFNNISNYDCSELKVYYSKGNLGELTNSVSENWASRIGILINFNVGISWQQGAIGIKLNRDDILVLSGNPRVISTLILLFRAKLLKVKVIWWGHYWSSTSKKWRQSLRLLPMILANALLFYTDVEAEAMRNRKLWCFKNKNISALNNGLDVTTINKFKFPYESASRNKECLFIGRLTEKSKITDLIYALSYINDKNIVVNVIGEGNDRGKLEILAKHLNVDKNFIWHGAVTDESKIANIANRCRLFVYPGSVGLSLIHAFAYGLPAILHNNITCHMPEVSAFEHNYNGHSFEYNDVASLAKTLNETINDDIKLNLLSKGTHVVGDSYTTDDMAIRFKELVKVMSER